MLCSHLDNEGSNGNHGQAAIVELLGLHRHDQVMLLNSSSRHLFHRPPVVLQLGLQRMNGCP